jgi:hypothetical protein
LPFEGNLFLFAVSHLETFNHSVMKNIYKILVLSCFLVTYHVQAKVITVSNREGDIAQHSTLGSALSEAEDGDIIYIYGSADSYGSFTLNRRLTLLGTGHNPENNDPLVSQVGQITLGVGSSGSQIIGISILSGIIFSVSSAEINDITIKRNSILTSFTSISINSNSKNWKIEENIFTRISSSSSGNFEENHLIRNNIILQWVSGIQFSTFSNNVFKFTSDVFSPQGSQSNSFINNIFFQNDLNSDFAANRIVNCTFNHNIFFGSNNPTSLPAGNNNTGENNVFADPLFVNVPNNSFNYAYDYSLQESSPGISGGTENTQIGLFGGIGYSVFGEPSIPQVTLFNIVNSIVPQNGNLNVRIEGKVNN